MDEGMSRRLKILAVGTCCVDVYPQKDVITPGGEALNIAAQLSTRDDVEVCLMAMIGDDRYGEMIMDHIKTLDINTDHLYPLEGDTGSHVIHIGEDGDRYFKEGAWQPGVSAEWSITEQGKTLLSGIDAVMTTFRQPNLQQLVELKESSHFLMAVDFNVQRDFSAWQGILDGIDIFSPVPNRA